MPGDEVHEDADSMVKAVLDAGGARTGPRHAAPRKSLLTRLQVPTGKAIAIAAMPSAVLMGMGLTPQLASAKGLPKSPFRDGPCVSQPDKAPDDADKKQDKSETDKSTEDDTSKDTSSKDGQDDSSAQDDKAEPTPSPSESEAGQDDSGSSDASGTDDQPEPSPSPSEDDKKSGGLLGGVGDVLGGLLGGGSSQQDDSTASKTAAEEPSSSSTGTEDDSAPVKDTLDGVKDGVKGATDAAGDAADKAKEAADKAAEDAKKAAEEATDDKSAAQDEQATDDSGKKAFPCVEEKKVAGDDEQAPVTLPNQPWHLKSSLLALHGLHYHGVVNLQTANGSTKQALKFTASGIDIHNLHQIIDGPNGLKYHVEAAKGSTSKIRNGTVTLYTEELKGNLFGLIPITFDPEHPPPLDIREVFFTNAEVTQAGQFGGTLTVPGLHSYMTGT